MTRSDKINLAKIQKQLDELLSLKYLIITKEDLISCFADSGVSFTDEGNLDIMELGFPFKTHEENKLKGYVYCYPPYAENKFLMKSFVMNMVKDLGKKIIEENSSLKKFPNV